MALSGSVSTILGATQKLFQAKAQAAWKQIADANKAANLQGAANKQTPQSAATAAILDRVDPATRKKLQAMQNDTDSLVKKLSDSSGESKKEAATRKADEAKRKLKALKLQAQMAAASGDKKAAARIAREVSQLAKELGQAAKDYGGGGTDAVTAVSGAHSAAAATAGAAKGEAAAAATAATSVAATVQPGATAPAATTGDVAKAQAAASTAAVSPPSAQTEAPEKATAETEGAEAPVTAEGESSAGTDTEAKGADTAVTEATDKTATDKAQADGAKAGATASPNNPTSTARTELDAKREAIMKEGAARKAAGEFYNDVRGSMAQLRSLLDQMKRLAKRDGEPGTATQMDQASRDMAEGEQMLNDAAGPGTLALPSGSLVQISV